MNETFGSADCPSDPPADPPVRQVDADDPARLLEALDSAFDYRGDVTLTLRDGRTLCGYIFDRHTGQGLDDSYVRMLPIDADSPVTIIHADIAQLAFTGKDAAHGKSWENWLKRYAESKRKGEKADLYPDNPET